MVTTSGKSNILIELHNAVSKRNLLAKRSWWTRFLLLKEDNVRFVLLAIVITIYLVLGAAIFQALEESFERERSEEFKSTFSSQMANLRRDLRGKNATMGQIQQILFLWGNASEEGLLRLSPKWDYGGSFHFVYTVVSTIGFGAAAPSTVGGRMFLIIYGLLGCSSGILFFNLFLERIITLLAYIMKANYERSLRRQVSVSDDTQSEASSESLESWKPSVYWVMFYLCMGSTVIAAIASVMFMKIEEWSYINSVYFCFVTFATIGFGDFVSAQRSHSFYGSAIYAYQFGNFFVMVLGCCCIYSLFNVISIVIKQTLNYVIRWLAVCSETHVPVPMPHKNGTTHHFPEKPTKHQLAPFSDSETERKLSGQVFTLHDYVTIKQSLQANLSDGRSELSSASSRKVSKDNFIPGQVGSLAIASSKFLGDD